MAALLVGRWPSGAPLMRTPTGDDARLADGISANAFRFDGAEPVHAFVGGNETRSHRRPGMTRACAARSGRTYARSIPETSRRRRVRAPPCSQADGGGCEHRHAHTPAAAARDSLRRRVRRRGADGPRELLFISYQTSITDQFEFLASSWMNSKSKPQEGAADGHDLLVGQNRAAGDGRVRRAAVQTAGPTGATHPFSTGTGPPWIFATGGGYFFAPSLSALTDVIAA
jgi:hypothetical protein